MGESGRGVGLVGGGGVKGVQNVPHVDAWRCGGGFNWMIQMGGGDGGDDGDMGPL